MLDRVTNATTRVSGAGDSAYYASISADASQIAYAVASAPCTGPDVSSPTGLEQSCLTSRVDVVYGATPGLSGSRTVETIASGATAAAALLNAAPQLSGNGRWITWVSRSGQLLLGQTRPELSRRHALLRRRDPGLSVDAVNFGALLAGTPTSRLPVVRNTGTTSVALDRIDVTGQGFAQVAGGTCILNMSLPPGATCTVNVRFTAPAVPGTYNGTITVGENGYDAVAAPNTLTGQSTALPPITTTTTSTTTTTTNPGTTTTTTTTTPGQILIDPQPRDIDFGQVPVGIGTPIRTITVTNTGSRPALITTVKGGAHPDDFFVSRNGCDGVTLAVGVSCTLDVLMSALAGADRTATLSFNVPGVGGEDVTVHGQGRFLPRLLASPSAISERGATTIIGQGFPNDLPVTVIIGETGLSFVAAPDAQGLFRVPLSAFPTLSLGSYVVRVDARADFYELVKTPLVVQLPTFQPQGPGGPVFGDTILVAGVEADVSAQGARTEGSAAVAEADVSRRARILRWGAAAVVALASGLVSTVSHSHALGAVIAVTPDNVVVDGWVGYVFHPQVSGRGEAVTLTDQEMNQAAFVFMDDGAPQPMVDGQGAAVSADGCVASWVRFNGSTSSADGRSIGITDRCRGLERELLRTRTNYDRNAEMSLSADGRFLVAQLPPVPNTASSAATIVRIDTTTREVRTMPFPAGAFTSNAGLGLDVSDDGNTVIATYTQNLTPSGVAAFLAPVPYLWDVPSNGIAALNGGGLFPSLSGNGRFVAVTSGAAMTGTEVGVGPWVYVHDRATGGVVRVSPVDGFGYYSSISGDGTQVAFGVGPAGCQAALLNEYSTNESCPISRIDVAFGATPGLSGGVSVETISTDVNDDASGVHVQPHLSWSGRWITWVSETGNALMGSPDEAYGFRQAYLRQRDGSLNVDPVDFGSLAAGTASTRLTTVRNTGRTTVFVDRIDGPAAPFSVVPGGTCVAPSTLPPGGSCTVNIRFVAPNAAGTSTGTITARETGFQPIVAPAAVSGASTVAPRNDTTTTSTTLASNPGTTVPSGGTTTTTSTTTPGQIVIDPQPRDIDFGQVPVGIGTPIRTITVTNTGSRPALITTVKGGAHPDDFFVSRTGATACRSTWERRARSTC